MAQRKKSVSPSSLSTIGRVASASVEKHTGRGWQEWIGVLEKAGARQLTHKEIAAFLVKKYKLSDWWKHIVATGFEIHTGRKREGQNERGEFTVTVTATLAIPIDKLWPILLSEEGLAIWLKVMDPVEVEPGAQYESSLGAFGEFRTLVKGSRLRFTWQEPDWEKSTTAQLGVIARPNKKSMISISHEKLKSERLKESLREQWRNSFNELRAHIDKLRS